MSFGGDQQVPTRLENFSFSNLTMIPTPAAWKVLTMFVYCFRMPRLNVRVYETGRHSSHHSGPMDVLLCRAHRGKVNMRRAIRTIYIHQNERAACWSQNIAHSAPTLSLVLSNVWEFTAEKRIASICPYHGWVSLVYLCWWTGSAAWALSCAYGKRAACNLAFASARNVRLKGGTI